MRRLEHEKMKHETESGFTLIEVLIAMAVLAVGLLGLAMMQAYFADGNAKSRQMIHATDIISNKIEELTNASPGDTGLDTGTHTDNITEYPIDYTLTWEVQDATTTNGDPVLDIDLGVTWSTGGLNHGVSFNWMRSK